MKIYITDGGSDSFFTAVFDAYNQNAIITSSNEVQLDLNSEVVRIETDKQKSARVQRGIEKYDKNAIGDILLALRSCDKRKEQAAFNYIRRIMQIKAPIKRRMSIPEVIEFNEIVARVTKEIHDFKGFLRFIESRDGVLYAPFAPDNDITDLLMPHFTVRLGAERFVIHDVKRKIAGLYDGNRWMMSYVGEAEIYLSEYEKAFENLWKKYYKAVNIESRPHEKQMKGYMPVRYWKFLTERKD